MESQAAAIVGVRRRMPELAALLELIGAKLRPSDRGTPQRQRIMDCLSILGGMAEGLERSGPPLSALIAAGTPELKAGFEKIETIWTAAALVAASREPVRERLAAIDLLARARPDLAEIAVPALIAARPARRNPAWRRQSCFDLASTLTGIQGSRGLEPAHGGHVAAN